MPKQDVLDMVSRLERIADTLPGRSYGEIAALAGQATGTMHAIRAEFDRYGIESGSQPIMNTIDKLGNTRDIYDMVAILHQIAGFFRGLAVRLPG